jgi:TolB protein
VAWLIVIVLAAAAYYRIFRGTRSWTASRRRVLPIAAGIAAAGAAALVAVGAASDGGTHVGPRVPLAAPPGALVVPYASSLRFHLYALRRDEFEQLTDSSAGELRPAVARDGRLAFQSGRDGPAGVYIARANGDPLRIADGGEPAWSPGGTRIAFVHDGDIYVARPNGSSVRRVTRGEWPAWFSDGRRIAFDRDGDLWSIDVTGGGERRLTRGPTDDRYPAVAATGLIVFERREHHDWHLWLLGSVPARLTSGPANDFAPAWTGVGKQIVFLSDRDGNDQLFSLDIGSRRLRRLTSTQGDKDAPALSP